MLRGESKKKFSSWSKAENMAFSDVLFISLLKELKSTKDRKKDFYLMPKIIEHVYKLVKAKQNEFIEETP